MQLQPSVGTRMQCSCLITYQCHRFQLSRVTQKRGSTYLQSRLRPVCELVQSRYNPHFAFVDSLETVFDVTNRKGSDQPVHSRRLVLAIVVQIYQITTFACYGSLVLFVLALYVRVIGLNILIKKKSLTFMAVTILL